MKAIKYILLIIFGLVITGLRAQDMSNAPDSVFFEFAKSLKNRGNDYYLLCNKIGIRQVIDEYRHALELRKTAGNLSVEMEGYFKQDTVKLLGDYYYLDSDYDSHSYTKAEKCFKQYRDYYLSHSGTYVAGLGIYVAHQELAQLYYKQGRYEEACDEMKEVVSIASSYMRDEDEQFDKLSQYAICLARVNRFDEALSKIEEVLDNYENFDSERYGEALRKKAKILMLREEQGGKTGKSEALDYYRQYFGLKKKDALAHFMGMNSEEREMYWMKIRPFVTDCYRLEDADAGFLYDVTLFAKGLLLQLDSTGGGRQNIHATWQMVQEKLKPDACAIEFIQYEKYGHQQMGALVLKRTGQPMFVRMITPDSILNYKISVKGTYLTVDSLIRSVHGADWDSRVPRNLLYSDSLGLNKTIWTPELIAAIDNCRHLWFSPDGYIHQLAIEYLLPETISSKSCHRLSSTRVLLSEKRGQYDKSALLVGGVDYYTKSTVNATGNDPIAYNYIYNKGRPAIFGSLDGSVDEVKEIFKLRKNNKDTLLVGAFASEQSFRKICGDYSMIHISSHGVFNAATILQGTDLKQNTKDNTLSQSLIAFAGINTSLKDEHFDTNLQDGILSAKEISSLDLSMTELVVLCCCETGLGFVTPDGVYGIQRGLKNAGAKAIICTLWDIDDEASSNFMIRFHQYLKENNDLYKAFYQARESMKEEYDEPSYRDAFILIDAF